MSKSSPTTVFHIGFPKTGSTFLQSYFDSHPNVHHNRTRLSEYVKTGRITESILEDLCEGETHDVFSEELLSIWAGDTKNVTLASYNMEYDFKSQVEKTASDIHTLFPNAKILIVTRGYKSLINSLYSQYILTGGTQNRKSFMRDSEQMILSLYNYEFMINVYRKQFSHENVIVLPFELLLEKPTRFIEVLENKLNLKANTFTIEKIHPSVPVHIIPFIRFYSSFYKKYLNYFSRKNTKEKFLNYLEFIYHFKESKFAMLFKGKKKHFTLSDTFVTTFSMNSRSLSSIDAFKEYLSAYN